MEDSQAPPQGGSPPLAKVTGIQFGLMTTANILNMSVGVGPEVLVRPKDLMNAYLGLPTANGQCLTCNGITVDQCQGHFGHILLSLPIFHPNHVDTLVGLLRKICLNCGQLRKKPKSPSTQESWLALRAATEDDAQHNCNLGTNSGHQSNTRKRRTSNATDPDHANIGLLSNTNSRNKGKLEEVTEEDMDDWPEAPKTCDFPENVIVLSSDDSDEENFGKSKEIQDTEAQHNSGKFTAPAATSSRQRVQKRKLPSDFINLNCKSASKFANITAITEDSASKSTKKSKTHPESNQPTKATERFSDDSVKTPSERNNYLSPGVCKYCSASSRRLGYPEPEIKVHVNLKGTSTEDPSNLVKFIKMRVKLKERENLAPDYWDFVEGSSRAEKNSKRGSRFLLPSEALKILKKIPQKNFAGLGMKAKIARPEALVLECLPIPPNCTRLQDDAFGSTNVGFKFGVDRATQAFERLLRKINSIKTSRFGQPSFQAAIIECSVMQALFQQYLREKGAPKTAPGKEKKKVDTSGRLQKRPSRWSLDWLKENIIGKRSGSSARNVVTGDPFLSVQDIGVPMDIAKHVTCSERVTDFNRSKLQHYIDIGQDLGQSRACGAMRIVRDGERREITRKTEIELETGDFVHRHLKDGDLVFINRPPSLHKHSLLALKAFIHSGATWTINPAICAPLHADFDGDCLHVFVPQTEESKAELQQLMTLPAQILPSPDENTIMGLSQDYVLATYLLTSCPLFLTKDSMHQLAMWTNRRIPVPTIVKSPKSGPLWTGKQVIDLTIPEDFSYQSSDKATQIQDGEILSCGKKSNWLASTKGLVCIIAQKNADSAVKHLDCSQSVLREWLLSHGFSVSLEDFYAAPDQFQRRKMKGKLHDSLEHAKSMVVGKVDQKTLTNGNSLSRSISTIDSAASSRRSRKGRVLEDAALSCFRHSQSQIGETFIESIPDSNALLAMVRSGSKGSNVKVMQQIGSLGLQVLKGEELLSTHKNPKLARLAAALGYSTDTELQDLWEVRGLVKSSLLDGLEPHEFFIHAIAARDGIYRQSLEIAEPGELFKRLMLFLRDIHIAYDGTVRNMGGLEIIQFQYEGVKSSSQDPEDTNPIWMETIMPGEAVGVLAATAISQPAYQVMLEAAHCVGSRKIRPLELLQESMFPRGTSKLKASDRKSILRLSRCACDEKYCEERRILNLQAELQPVTLETLATETAIEYASESSEQWEAFDFGTEEMKRTPFLPWIGHIQLDEMVLDEKKMTPAMILERLDLKVKVHKSVLRKFRIGNIIFCSRDRGDCHLKYNQDSGKLPQKPASGPCLHFAFARGKVKVRSLRTKKQKNNEAADLLEIVQSSIIPNILNTVIKGSEKIESANVIWEDEAWSPPIKSAENDTILVKAGGGELVLEVTVKEIYSLSRGMPWQIIQESCLRIMDCVDWQRSSPYSIQEIKSIFGVDAARDVLLQRFELAAENSIGKKHLKLVAELMVYSGEVQGLTSYGYRDWMRSLQISTPFTAGVFRAPMKHFIEAGRRGVTERFKGVLASSVFGKKVPLGTGADFTVNLNIKPQFNRRPSSKMDSGCSAEGDAGDPVDILDRLIGLNSEIAVEEPPVTSQFGTAEANNSCDMAQDSEWGSGAIISQSEGGWGACGLGSENTATVANGNLRVDEKDANQTDTWGGSNDTSQWEIQNGDIVPGGGWGCPDVETSNSFGNWGAL